MGDVITLPVVRVERLDDGGKARLRDRRARLFPYGDPALAPTWYRAWVGETDDLTMDHADNGLPSDSAYSTPDSDPA